MNGFQGDFLRGALDVSPDGVVICEANEGQKVVYVNSAFCRLTGYETAELLGKNLRFLQGEDTDQQELDSLREAMRHHEAVRVLVRNQRKDGTVFVNDMQIYPLRNAEGKATHLIGYHREGGSRVRTGDTGIRGLPNWVREDRLTGLASRYYFEDVLKRDFALAQRDKTDIALLLFDIDQLGPYNEIFDRAGGDAVVKRVARAIAGSFRRGTDIVGRWEGASVIVLMHGTTADHVIQHATTVAHRVREQQIHHPRSTQKYVTVSGGVAIHTARAEDTADKFLKAAESAVTRAKEQGRNRIIVAEESDFR
jgi:diguanylate cyclase (GGDEF)-like protein/PAS domain S-box-containing protein